MKNIIKLISILVVTLLISLTFFGCGASKNAAYEDSYYEGANDYGYSYNDGVTVNGVTAEDYGNTEESYDEKSESSETTTDRKLVRTASLDVQTKAFDSFISSLESKVTELEGYVECANIGDGGYYSSNTRYANYTVRVPADKLDEFINTVSEIGKVTDKSIEVSDITTNYIDTESHIKALKAEQTALLAILEKATKVSDTIEVYSRISEVNAQLESYERTLKSYDNQVSYSKVKLTIDEVERITETEQEGFFAETARRLKENLYSLGQSLRNFGIWFLSSIPYIVIYAVLLAVVIVIIKKIIRKRKAKKNKNISE